MENVRLNGMRREAIVRMRRFMMCGSIFALVLFLSGFGICAAAEEDMRFADAEEDTGYYVDAASIVRRSDTERDAVVAVIKVRENRRYLYHMRFDRKAETYQILSAQVEVYDTREILRTMQGMDAPQPYTPVSPMRSVVDFIEELLAEQQKENTTIGG